MKKIIAILILSSAIYNLFAQKIDFSKIEPHPRLFLKGGQEQQIHDAINNNAALSFFHKRIISNSDLMINEPVVERIQEGKRLLAVSRTVFMRVFYLSYAYRMTGEDKYWQRAEKEMLAAAAFSDWNPSHFLDVGEMTMGMAIGYDWLYSKLSNSSRNIIRKAIVEKGLDAAKTKKANFYRSKTNWNQVCNGGLVCGALAVYENESKRSKWIINKALETLPLALHCYGPDGGYPEGFGYWTYGTSYQVMLNDALETALGTDAGLSEFPGFLNSAKFIQYMTAPGGDCFNFADTSPKAFPNIMLFWFAHKMNDLSLLWLEKDYLTNPELVFGEYMEERFLPCLLIFASRINVDKISVPTGNFWFSKGLNPVFIYRGGWQSKDDTYLGVKGGTASSSHAHMDAGSFIYERGGVRWAMDLGMQDYYSLESKNVDLWNMTQTSQRWDVFRLGSDVHNTITLDGQKHRIKGFAEMNQTFESKDKKGAEINMTSVLGEKIQNAIRTVYLDGEDNLEIIDSITNGSSLSTISWTMCTPADVEKLDGNTIVLKKDNKRLMLEVESPSSISLFIKSNEPPNDYDFKNTGSQRVGYTTLVQPHQQVEVKVSLRLINE